ncbi:MAG: hypothetical protein Q9190_002695 [Brigantiaea leucoxantha]
MTLDLIEMHLPQSNQTWLQINQTISVHTPSSDDSDWFQNPYFLNTVNTNEDLTVASDDSNVGRIAAIIDAINDGDAGIPEMGENTITTSAHFTAIYYTNQLHLSGPGVATPSPIATDTVETSTAVVISESDNLDPCSVSTSSTDSEPASLPFSYSGHDGFDPDTSSQVCSNTHVKGIHHDIHTDDAPAG